MRVETGSSNVTWHIGECDREFGDPTAPCHIEEMLSGDPTTLGFSTGFLTCVTHAHIGVGHITWPGGLVAYLTDWNPT